jgi:hypothetical protein
MDKPKKEADIRAEWVPGNPHDRSITGFRIRHGSARGPMSKQKYSALRKKGRGPVESCGLITVEAEAVFDRAMTAPKGAMAKMLAREAKARRERAINAAKRGAAKRKNNKLNKS